MVSNIMREPLKIHWCFRKSLYLHAVI